LRGTNLEEATWIGEAPRLDARCVRRETDAGIEFATRMDDADMAVEGGAMARHKRGTTDELATLRPSSS